MFDDIYKSKRILITGHTGFKGSWITAWLLKLGANVAGYSIDIPTQPSHFEILNLQNKIQHHVGDVCDLQNLKKVFDEFKPEIVFHLAAQSLVKESYENPHKTFEINALGTLNVLECIRQSRTAKAAVMITSDKAYRNVEWEFGYRETDMLGGEDPYSGSKGCAELICYSYIKSYFNSDDAPKIATARAGNVIGGGDWAENRIVPDCMQAWSQGKEVCIRSPNATRPWQHVLEPLSGYLWLAAQLWLENKKAVGESFNFGPDSSNEISVKELIDQLSGYWQKANWKCQGTISDVREADLLKLCCDKALHRLQWQPTLSFKETVRLTSEWYQSFYNETKTDMFELCRQQIDHYVNSAKEKSYRWQKEQQREFV